MQAGRLRHLVNIQSETVTRNATTNQVTARSWTTQKTAWAEIRPVAGREIYRSYGILPQETHAVSMRCQSGITPAMRLQYGTRILHVARVLDVEEQGRELLLMCEERL